MAAESLNLQSTHFAGSKISHQTARVISAQLPVFILSTVELANVSWWSWSLLPVSALISILCISSITASLLGVVIGKPPITKENPIPQLMRCIPTPSLVGCVGFKKMDNHWYYKHMFAMRSKSSWPSEMDSSRSQLWQHTLTSWSTFLVVIFTNSTLACDHTKSSNRPMEWRDPEPRPSWPWCLSLLVEIQWVVCCPLYPTVCEDIFTTCS